VGATKQANTWDVPLKLQIRTSPRVSGGIGDLAPWLNSQFLGHPDEARERIGLHFLHYPATLNLDGNFGSAQLRGDVFIGRPFTTARITSCSLGVSES